MPYHITLPLQADPERPYPAGPHRALQAAFYHWLSDADPALAARVHGMLETKPFTVIPLHQRNGVLCAALTLLDDGLWPALEAVLDRDAAVEIGDARYPVMGAARRVIHRSYPELVVGAPTETHLAFGFRSPTSFRSSGMHYPLPDPVLVVQSWLLRWNAFAPLTLQINANTLDLAAAHLALSRHRIETRTVDFGRYAQVGFVGRVTYQVVGRERLSDDLLRRFNVLADYAPFCGTGHKTTQGMGWTEREAR